MLLFGKYPKKFLPQSGIRAVAYPGLDPSYETIEDADLSGPLTALSDELGAVVGAGLVEQALDFVHRTAAGHSEVRSGARVDTRAVPDPVLREVVVNALVHRDYSVAGSDVMLEVFADRVVVTSPGRLPNSVTVAGMLSGFRYARNQTLVNVMRDYRYVENRGMGIRAKVVPGMLLHNGSEPVIRAGDEYVRVTLIR
jgi:ATP-dependent DNA helicase RecG